MKFVTGTLARWLISLPFIVLGIGHFMNGDAMAGMIPAWLPGGVTWVYIIGACLVAGGVALVFRFQEYYAGLGLALLMLLFVLLIHVPTMQTDDPMSKMMGMIGMFKDLGLAGGALTLAGLSRKD